MRIIVAAFILIAEPATAQMRLDPNPAPSGPPPTALAVMGTPSTATITWAAPAGATGFKVLRSVPAGSWTTLTPTAITATSFMDQSGFVAGSAYVYRVVAYYAGGASGLADVNFQAPPPVNPSWVKATAQGKDIVVTWAPVPGASRYAVAGQSQAEWRDVAAGVTSVTYYGVPAGSYQYRVAAIYDPGAIQTPATSWPSATISTKATSGRYRISIAGFRVNKDAYDNQLNSDGLRNEVYAAAVVAEFDRATGKLRRTDFVQSEVHGDAKGFAGREPVGSAGSMGGLIQGDAVPSGWYPTYPSPAPRLPGRFPFTLWEGTLNDATDAVVIRPGLWEWNGNPMSFYAWRDMWLKQASLLWSGAARNAAAGTILVVLRENRSPFYHPSQGKIDGTAIEPADFMAGGRDRLLGLDILVLNQPDPLNDLSRVYWVERLFVVTREIIEAALAASTSQQLAPGVAAMALVDTETPSVETTLNGDYTVYFRVERLP